MRHLPASSNVGVAQHGAGARWGSTEHLLAGIFDVLAGANWQRGGGKGARPKPHPRPGSERRTVGKPIPIEEARKRREKTLGRPA